MKTKRRSILIKTLFCFGMLFGTAMVFATKAPSASYAVDGPSVGSEFTDDATKLFFSVSSVGEKNTVEVIGWRAPTADLVIPSTVTNNGVTFTVTSVANAAFNSFGVIKTVTIPKTVTNIGTDAFYNASITTITVKSKVPASLGQRVFSNSKNLIVPFGTKETYTRDSQWRLYGFNITEAGMTIEDVLTESFPTSSATGFVGSSGNTAYQDDNYLIFNNGKSTLCIDKTLNVNKNGTSYTYIVYPYNIELKTDLYGIREIIFNCLNDNSFTDFYFPLTYEDFYLCGIINGKACGIGQDSANVDAAYQFNDKGKLSVTFTEASFVQVKTRTRIYAFQDYHGDGTADVVAFDKDYCEYMFVPAGTPYLFTLLNNEDGSYTLGYAVDEYNVSVSASSFGTLSQDFSKKVLVGTTYTIDGNKLTIGDTEIVVTPNKGYAFAEWKVGNTAVTGSGTINKDTDFVASYDTIALTLKDVLPEDFPVTKETGWENGKGSKLYYNNNTLYINDNFLSIGFNDQVKFYYNSTLEAYAYSETHGSITIYIIFNIDDNTGVLESITVSKDPADDGELFGTYVAPLADSKENFLLTETAELTYEATDGVASLDFVYEDYQMAIELYYDSALTEIPEGTYVFSDLEESGTALISSGILEGVPQKSFISLTNDSGEIEECWLLVNGTVTVEYDNLNRLTVEVDAENTNGKLIQFTGVYVPSYSVSITAGENGTISSAYSKDITTGTAYTIDGNKLTIGGDEIVATANEGYEFDSWMIGDDKVTVDGTITEDTSFTATFALIPTPTYEVSVVSGDNGSISAAFAKDIEEGTAYTVNGNKLTIGDTEITATANEGFEFDAWVVGESKVTENGTIAGDISFKATFKAIPVTTYLVNVLSGDNGSISAAFAKDIEEGTTYTVNGNKLTIGEDEIVATANEGYEFDSWKIGEQQVTSAGTITNDVTFTATFKVIPVTTHLVKVESGENGSVSPAFSKDVEDGTAYTVNGNKLTIGDTEITATASEGFEFDSWVVGESKVTENGTIAGDISFKATFKAKENPIIPDPQPEEPIDEETGLSGGAIAGITVGSVAAASLVAYGAMFIVWKKKGKALKFLVRSFEWLSKSKK